MNAEPLPDDETGVNWIERQVRGLEAEVEENTQRLTVRRASSIKPRPAYWLWENRIPLRNLTLEAGRAGIGKSTFDAWLVAQVTLGRLDGHYTEPKNVIVVATEDDWEATIIPRLIAAGADLDRVLQVEAVEMPGQGYTVSLACDLGEVERIVREHEVALIVFDPMVSVARGARWNAAEEIRPLLEKLRDRVLGPLNCAAVGLIHFRKAMSADVLDMITGSGAWTQVARSVIAFAVDDDLSEASGQRVVVVSQAKSNLGSTDLPNLTFGFEPVEIETDEGPARTARIAWGDESAWSAEEILMGRKTEAAVEKSASAEEWLGELLASGARLVSEVKVTFESEKAARLVKFSWRTVERASKTVAVKSRDGRNGPWLWALNSEAVGEWRRGEDSESGEDSEEWVESSPGTRQLASPRQNMSHNILPAQGAYELNPRHQRESSPPASPSPRRRTALIQSDGDGE